MLRIGLVGAGHLGNIHLKCINMLEDAVLAGVYDADQTIAENAAKNHNTKSYPTLEDLIEDCDIVDIVTPTLSHYEVARKAIMRGKHIFIEKPITETANQAKELIKLAEESGVKAQVGHVERYNPAFLQARPYIQKPMFIESHRLAEFNPRGTDVPVVLDLMIHDIDIALSIVKSPIKKISASGVAVISDTPDITNARLEFANGCVANLTASRISLKNMRKTRIFQRDAYITVDFLDKQAEVIRMETIEPTTTVDDLAIVLENANGEKKRIFFETPKTLQNNAIHDELKSLVDAVNNNTPSDVTLEDGKNALMVAEEILSIINPS
ncbi:MAG: Gfo/Idh/MocA family oxidoreductase [Cryomorphaceae bacterium]|nr:Gfo/Idh/MocA family oxidoreductase [Cryomorphaceae bacterium]